jgi:hypothetical protein
MVVRWAWAVTTAWVEEQPVKARRDAMAWCVVDETGGVKWY